MVEQMGKFDLILVTWNSARWLRASLPGFAALEGLGRIVVIDNASEDDSVELVRSLLPSATVIGNETNRGFAAAVNQGVAATNGSHVLLVNPDLRLAPDYGVLLVEALTVAGGAFGAATGRLMGARGESIEPTGVVDSEGIRITRSGRHFDIAQGEIPDESAHSREVFGVSGAAAIYTRAFVDDVSIEDELFDERFFAYREDADLAWRGRVFGWKALFEPRAVGWHVRRVTPAARRTLPPQINLHSVRNRFLLRVNNQGRWLALRHAPFQLWRDLVVLLAVLLRERSSLPALAWLWNNRRQAWERRRWIQARRRIADREIAHWFR